MAPTLIKHLFERDDVFVSADVPRPALIISTVVSILAACLLTVFIVIRVRIVKNWRNVPATHLLVLAIYSDSLCFVTVTAVLSHGWGINSSPEVCSAAILLCLCCYMSTKVLTYYFLVEKVYIIRRVSKPRYQSKLYLFNCFGVLVPFLGVIVLNFVYRISHFQDGTCIIGMERKVLMPLIIYDLVINVWLTTLFVMPLRQLYTYKNNKNSSLRIITIRTFIGSCVTLTSSIVNLSVLMALQGEPAWVCLMCCNCDILFTTIVLFWVTTHDTPDLGSSNLSAPRHNSDGIAQPYRGDSGKSVVVTNITSQAKSSSDDISDMTGKLRDSHQLRKIEVTTDYVREVSTGKESVKEGEKSGDKSTEDLVYRN